MYKLLALIPAAAVALSATSLKSPTAGAVSGDWPTFRDKAMGVVTSHPIVQGNSFTEWFAEGAASEAQQRDLVQQFSVFSQLFLIAQLSKIINAPSLEEMREGKEILANEIGVIFNNKKDKGTGGEELLSCEGTVEGGTFRHRAAHFEWLVDVAEPLGLGFNDLGKRRLGTKETLHFCDELSRLYANEADSTAIAASFAIENWAAAGFWDDLVAGFKAANGARSDEGKKKLPISFWTFHSALEQQHADHTIDELQECFEDGRIANEDEFCATCTEMLDAVQVFWEGLDATRKRL
jgi:hypothetical protein